MTRAQEAGRVWWLIIMAVLLLLAGLRPSAAAGSHFTVFAYSRFDDEDAPSQSTASDLLDQQIAELTGGGYTIVDLESALAQLAQGQKLPDNAVAITVDGASAGFATIAWPRFKAARVPVTLFIATDPIDRGGTDTLDWATLRQLSRDGVAIANLTASDSHLIGQNRDYVLGQLRRADDRIRAEIGTTPTLVAYPFGEADRSVRAVTAGAGYRAAFGIHAGAIDAASDRFLLSRFTLNDLTGQIGRIRLAATALPLPVSDLMPVDMVVGANRPEIGFSVDAQAGALDDLACFIAGMGQIDLQRPAPRRVALKLDQSLPPGRVRINCTMPTSDGHWFWFGRILLVPGE